MLTAFADVRASISITADQMNAAARNASLKKDVAYGHSTVAPPRTHDSSNAVRGNVPSASAAR